MDKSKLTVAVMMAAYQKMGYPLTDESKGFNPNLCGIRNSDINSNSFNDLIVLWSPSGFIQVFDATTDPGTFWRLHPMNVEGTGILCTGYYKACFTRGLHQGKYKALVQKSAVSFYRDNNKDAKIDRKKETLKKGIVGMNLHHAGINSILVDKWSAMCQVMANHYTNRPGFDKPVLDFDYFMGLAEKMAINNGDKFDYCLFLEKEVFTAE